MNLVAVVSQPTAVVFLFLLCQRGGERSKVSSFPLNCGVNAEYTFPSVTPIEGVTCETIVLIVSPDLVAGVSPLGCKSRIGQFVGQECDVTIYVHIYVFTNKLCDDKKYLTILTPIPIPLKAWIPIKFFISILNMFKNIAGHLFFCTVVFI